MKRYFAIILFAAALASCTPKLYDAQVEVPENYRFAGDFPQDSVSLPFAWWEIFGDSTLNRLVEHALENNRNLAQAASRIFEARANIAVARAAANRMIAKYRFMTLFVLTPACVRTYRHGQPDNTEQGR